MGRGHCQWVVGRGVRACWCSLSASPPGAGTDRKLVRQHRLAAAQDLHVRDHLLELAERRVQDKVGRNLGAAHAVSAPRGRACSRGSARALPVRTWSRSAPDSSSPIPSVSQARTRLVRSSWSIFRSAECRTPRRGDEEAAHGSSLRRRWSTAWRVARALRPGSCRRRRVFPAGAAGYAC